jgi:urease accessory protein
MMDAAVEPVATPATCALVPPVTDRSAGEGWLASLALEFERRGTGSYLAARRHSGPLYVQRALYPEGPERCHAIVVHPPGGIAGGDVVDLRVSAAADAHVVLTTPGAAKLYKGAGRVAKQRIELVAHARSCIEWLPQETIVFDGADALLALDVDAAAQALVVAWDVVTLGREAMGERFGDGRLRCEMQVRIDGRLALWESSDVAGGSPWLRSQAGWRDRRACGAFIVAGRAIDDALVEQCRDALGGALDCAVSRLDTRLLVARFLGASATGARQAFCKLWSCVRPALAGVRAQPLRIWST